MDIHSPRDALGGWEAYDGHGSLFLTVDGLRWGTEAFVGLQVLKENVKFFCCENFSRFWAGRNQKALPCFWRVLYRSVISREELINLPITP